VGEGLRLSLLKLRVRRHVVLEGLQELQVAEFLLGQAFELGRIA
jgi:hypothetical protein